MIFPKGAQQRLKGWLRREKQLRFPDRQTRIYRHWIEHRLAERKQLAYPDPPPGLFSIITAVWNGSPVQYLTELARSIATQNQNGTVEWVILSNGCSHPDLIASLNELARLNFVHVIQSPTNVGIAGGLRLCLEHTRNQYVLPIDADDLLFPDSLALAANFVAQAGFPPLLYSDEDKIQGDKCSQPYFKADWDPLLLTNSAYIAHLGIVDRTKALELGAYTDPVAEGSVDWDLFLRFSAAGFAAVHIPEMLYRWRIHPSSTADDGKAKLFIGRSQTAALERYLQVRRLTDFRVVESALLPGGQHFRLERVQVQDPGEIEFIQWAPGQRLDQVLSATGPDLVCFYRAECHHTAHSAINEAIGVLRLFPEIAVVGGRVLDSIGRVLEGGRQFGFGNGWGCPDYGRDQFDAGYFGLAFKQRFVDAVSMSLAVVRREFLHLAVQGRSSIVMEQLGSELALQAQSQDYRVAYTPYWTATADFDSELEWRVPIQSRVVRRRYYPASLSLRFGYCLESEEY